VPGDQARKPRLFSNSYPEIFERDSPWFTLVSIFYRELPGNAGAKDGKE
jgi:hypothetical protein